MKRITSLLLALLLLLTGFAFAQDAPKHDMNANLTYTIKGSAEEWFSTSSTRALLTAYISLDFLIWPGNTDLHQPLVNETSYVARDGDTLLVYLQCENKDVLIEHTPANGKASYTLIDPIPDDGMSALEESLSSTYRDGCYENSIEEIQAVLDLLIQGMRS